MNPILLDMVWPALYVSQSLYKFWFLVFGTIILEAFVIRYFLKFSWTKSVIASSIGNSVSGFVGTFVMMWAMLFWDLLADNFVPYGTFGMINWIVTYILMCLGSVFLETLTIKIIYKEKIKRLFLPMMTGNFLSYAFIAIVMITATDKDPKKVRTEVLKYLPNKQYFVLLDNNKMQIDTSTINISYDKDNNQIKNKNSKGYKLHIPFKKQVKGSFQFEFKILGEKHGESIYEASKNFNFNDLKNEYKIILEQKNPNKALGWTQPIITDTLIFKRIVK